jgi:hypothetical protein
MIVKIGFNLFEFFLILFFDLVIHTKNVSGQVQSVVNIFFTPYIFIIISKNRLRKNILMSYAQLIWLILVFKEASGHQQLHLLIRFGLIGILFKNLKENRKYFPFINSEILCISQARNWYPVLVKSGKLGP